MKKMDHNHRVYQGVNFRECSTIFWNKSMSNFSKIFIIQWFFQILTSRNKAKLELQGFLHVYIYCFLNFEKILSLNVNAKNLSLKFEKPFTMHTSLTLSLESFCKLDLLEFFLYFLKTNLPLNLYLLNL